MAEDEIKLLKFPCQFPIKIVGMAGDAFETAVYEVLQSHVPNLAESAISTRQSKDGKYLAITVTILATSQEQLDNIYLALGKVQGVVMCL